MRKNYYLRNGNSYLAVTVRRYNKVNKARLILFILSIAVLILAAFAIADASAIARADKSDELTDGISSILDGLDLSGIQNYLDEYGNDFVFGFGDGARQILEFLIKGDLGVDYAQYLKRLFSVLFNGVTDLFPSFAQIIAISVLCSISADAEGGVLNKSTAKVVRLACLSLITLILSSILVGIFSAAVKCVAHVQMQVEIITPILITLTVLTGGSASGAIYQPSALFLSSGAIEIISGFVFPSTIAVIVLHFLSKLNPQISFSGTAALIKSVLKWVIGITVAVFGLFLTVQSSASSLFNGIFFKVTKYLVGNSVPIVGNFLSAGVDMVVMSGSLVRSSVGVLGVVMLLSETIQPVMLLASFSVMLKISGAIVQPLGEKSAFSLFTDLSKDVEFIIAGILTVAFMYLLVVMLMVNSVGYFI